MQKSIEIPGLPLPDRVFDRMALALYAGKVGVNFITIFMPAKPNLCLVKHKNS